MRTPQSDVGEIRRDTIKMIVCELPSTALELHRQTAICLVSRSKLGFEKDSWQLFLVKDGGLMQ